MSPIQFKPPESDAPLAIIFKIERVENHHVCSRTVFEMSLFKSLFPARIDRLNKLTASQQKKRQPNLDDRFNYDRYLKVWRFMQKRQKRISDTQKVNEISEIRKEVAKRTVRVQGRFASKEKINLDLKNKAIVVEEPKNPVK